MKYKHESKIMKLKYIKVYEEYELDNYAERLKNSQDLINKYRAILGEPKAQTQPKDLDLKPKLFDYGYKKDSDVETSTGVSVKYLPMFERREEDLDAIASAIHGDPQKDEFSTKFNPIPGKSLEDRYKNFKIYLKQSIVKHLWSIKYNGETVGCFSVADVPSDPNARNAVGFSINVNYAGKGIMAEAFNLIKKQSRLEYPLFGYTSEQNIAAQKLMLKLGFKEDRRFLYNQEPTIGYVLHQKD